MHPFVLALRDVVGFTLFAAGAAKVGQGAELGQVVRQYRVLPASLARPAAELAPWLEIGIASLLFAGRVQVAASTAAACLFSVFAAAIAVNLARGRRIECGCFGIGRTFIGWWTLSRSTLLAGAAGVVAIVHPPASAGHEDSAIAIVAIVLIGFVRTAAQMERLLRSERTFLRGDGWSR